METNLDLKNKVMIKGLFETHLFVENLSVSIEFYKKILELEQCYYEAERKAAFFWIGKPKEAMLGLWEKPKNEIEKRHFAFSCDKEFILHHSVEFLKSKNLKPYNFLKDETERPMVFAWMPALAIYFNDLDGHYLEFISILDGDARPELGVISYDEWLKQTSAQYPKFEIKSSEKISIAFIKNNISNFQQAIDFVVNLPYGRNTNKEDLTTVFSDACGTCSTKHALLKQLAIENNFTDLKLILGIVKMDATNTPQIAETLSKCGLAYIPEAHNYLKYEGRILDLTKPNFTLTDCIENILEEIEILPNQITDYKVSYHKNYLEKWLNDNEQIKFSLSELWAIREQCIQDLSI